MSRRRLVPEILDDPAVPDDIRARSLADVERSNRLFGGLRAVLRALDDALPALPAHASLLDVGTGAGDVPAAARDRAARRGISLTTLGVDLSPSLVRDGRHRIGLALCGDAFHLPFATASIDVVTCSQLLHHFTEEEALMALAELHRVARHRVIISDLRRSRLAAWGYWLASFPLGFHAVTRHDGPVSVMRGFTAEELRRWVRTATGATPDVVRRIGWRLTAAWTPVHGAAAPNSNAAMAGVGA